MLFRIISEIFKMEIFMRKFILNNFDAVIGMSHNTKEDLISEFGICGKKIH